MTSESRDGNSNFGDEGVLDQSRDYHGANNIQGGSSNQRPCRKRKYTFNDRVVSYDTHRRLCAEMKKNYEKATRLHQEVWSSLAIYGKQLGSTVEEPDTSQSVSHVDLPLTDSACTSPLASLSSHDVNINDSSSSMPPPNDASNTCSPEKSFPTPPTPTFEADTIDPSSSPPLSPEPHLDNDEKSSHDFDLVERQMLEIEAVFVKHGITLAAQRDFLKVMRNLRHETQNSLPKDGRSLRPTRLNPIITKMKPGSFAYFGILNIVNIPDVNLIDCKATVLKLTANIDGLPLFRSSGVGLWPILGCFDNKEVFLIGVYAGKKKPACSNEFLKFFVDEVCELTVNGITVNGKVYRFILDKIMMDAPAKSYILGVKGHTSITSCTKCKVIGVRVPRRGLASTNILRQKGRAALSFLDMDAEPRQSDSFMDDRLPSCDPKAHCQHEPYWNEDDDELNSDSENDEDSEEKPDIDEHFRHRTILTKIPNFSFIDNIPLDYMHLVCVGAMKKLLTMFVGDRTILSAKNNELASRRLMSAKEYCPCEFQRKPESLNELSFWKATQYRVFLLYIGVAIFHGLIDAKYYQNFCQLVVSMRCMTKEVGGNVSSVLEKLAGIARWAVRKFVEDGINLYGPEFAVYNIHNLIHAPRDYLRHGPLDGYSCFRFESFLGRLKKYVRSAFLPLQQIINVYSSRLLTKQFTLNGETEIWDDVKEYYERPQLRMPRPQKKLPQSVEGNEDIVTDLPMGQCEKFTELRFRSFTLRSDKKADCHCLIGGSKFVKITGILREITTKEIYVVGKYYQIVTPVFTEPVSSTGVGMVFCSEPTGQSHTFPLSALQTKCFAFPLSDDEAPRNDTIWGVTQYLH